MSLSTDKSTYEMPPPRMPMNTERDREELAECASYLQRILAGEVLLHRARIDIARICNFGCPFCFSVLGGEPSPGLAAQCVPLDVIQGLAAQFRKLGVRVINLYGGGEPTLHPQIAEVLEAFSTTGAKMRIITNGSRLTPLLRDAIERLRAHVDTVRISMPGVSARSHKEVTGTPLFESITANVAALVKQLEKHDDAPEVGLYVPVTMAFPSDEIEAFVDYAIRAHVDWLLFRDDIRFSPSEDGDEEQIADRRFDDVKATVTRLAEQHPEFGLSYVEAARYPKGNLDCYVGLTDLCLSWDSLSRKLVLVRCEHLIPPGWSERPPEGFYELIGPSSLYAVCEEQLRRFRAGHRPQCARPDYCLTRRRNERLRHGLEVLARG